MLFATLLRRIRLMVGMSFALSYNFGQLQDKQFLIKYTFYLRKIVSKLIIFCRLSINVYIYNNLFKPIQPIKQNGQT